MPDCEGGGEEHPHLCGVSHASARSALPFFFKEKKGISSNADQEFEDFKVLHGFSSPEQHRCT